jgi:hypothetical protein
MHKKLMNLHHQLKMFLLRLGVTDYFFQQTTIPDLLPIRMESEEELALGFFGGSGGGILTVPIGLNYLVGKSPNFLEAGFGYTYATITGGDGLISGSGSLFFPSIGYRYQQIGNGLMARIVISPAIAANNGGGWIFFGGIGVGYKF